MSFYVTISQSSIGTFRKCARMWLYAYQRNLFPSEFRRELAFAKRLMPFNALAGQIVDDVITGVLRRYHRHPEFGFGDDHVEGAAKLLEQYVQKTAMWRELYDSDAETIEPEPGKRQAVQSYFFEGPPDESAKEKLLAKVEVCLRSWRESTIPEFLASTPLQEWRLPPSGSTPSFRFENIKVYAKYDFATKSPYGARIIDWKSGILSEWSERSAKEQVHVYGAYAKEVWRANPDSILLEVVWLAAGAEHCRNEAAFDEGFAREILSGFADVQRDIVKRLDDCPPGDIVALEGAFPITDRLDLCRDCAFRCCEGYKRVMTAGDEKTGSSDAGADLVFDDQEP